MDAKTLINNLREGFREDPDDEASFVISGANARILLDAFDSMREALVRAFGIVSEAQDDSTDWELRFVCSTVIGECIVALAKADGVSVDNLAVLAAQKNLKPFVFSALPSSTTLERMARAMWLNKYGSYGLRSTLPFDDAPADFRDKYRWMAMSALSEIREPSLRMLNAAWEAGGSPGMHWQAMIDAALAEAGWDK